MVPAVGRETRNAGEAASWWLLDQDPFAEGGPASPFWAVAPILEAWGSPAHGRALAALVREEGAAVSGLRLDDGALPRKVAASAWFDLCVGTVELRLRCVRASPGISGQIGNLWKIAGIPAPPAGRGPAIAKF